MLNVSELKGAALDWAVAKCESLCLGEDLFGLKPIIATPAFTQRFKPSTNWAQGGPIIEREKMAIMLCESVGDWLADLSGTDKVFTASGPTPLVAAMRCYCCAKLGDEIDIPEELQPCQQPNL